MDLLVKRSLAPKLLIVYAVAASTASPSSVPNPGCGRSHRPSYHRTPGAGGCTIDLCHLPICRSMHCLHSKVLSDHSPTGMLATSIVGVGIRPRHETTSFRMSLALFTLVSDDVSSSIDCQMWPDRPPWLSSWPLPASCRHRSFDIHSLP